MHLIQRVASLRRALAGGQEIEALLVVDQENLDRLMEQLSRALASHAGLVERLMARRRFLEQEELTQRLRVAVRLRVGSRADAGRAALELQTLQRELTSSREQLVLAEELHQSLTKIRELAIAAAKAKIESACQTIGDQRAQRMIDKLDEVATAAIGSGAAPRRISEMAEGRGRNGQPGHKAEQAALAAALEEFLAQDGGLVVQVGAPPIIVPSGGNE